MTIASMDGGSQMSNLTLRLFAVDILVPAAIVLILVYLCPILGTWIPGYLSKPVLIFWGLFSFIIMLLARRKISTPADFTVNGSVANAS
ncbi:MAG: hypothetical protein QXV22_03375 [Thermoplasmataceae archaeon]